MVENSVDEGDDDGADIARYSLLVSGGVKGVETIVSYSDPTERAHLLESQRSKHTVGRNVICADAAEGKKGIMARLWVGDGIPEPM
jgi:hypothetical protein